jgi:hypothetical protein
MPSAFCLIDVLCRLLITHYFGCTHCLLGHYDVGLLYLMACRVEWRLRPFGFEIMTVYSNNWLSIQPSWKREYVLLESDVGRGCKSK